MPNKWGNLPRRAFLQAAGLSAAGCLSKAAASAADVELALQATLFDVPLWPGTPTRVWGYKGEVIYGDPRSLQPLQAPARGYPVRYVNSFSQAPLRRGRAPYSYLGPLIRAQRGQRVRLHFTNQLPEATVIHWRNRSITVWLVCFSSATLKKQPRACQQVTLMCRWCCKSGVAAGFVRLCLAAGLSGAV